MESSVIVGSSWGKVLKHCNSWGQKVITPKKQKQKQKKQKTKNKKQKNKKTKNKKTKKKYKNKNKNKTYTIHALKHDYILS
jgi:hypothetical protein